MMATVRALNVSGVERFSAYLAALKEDSAARPPIELLADPGATRELPIDAELAPQPFASRLEFAKTVATALSALPPDEADGDVGLWAWLALFYFDQLAPPDAEGKRRAGVAYRYVPDFDFRYRHRHLVYGPYQLYRRHGVRAFPLLSGPLHLQNAISW
ncbi:MAG: hypothetical protein AAGD86_04920 [Pseudomonadota bacterium]